MEVRQAEPADQAAIRDVARRSLETSYSLSPKAITSAVEQWYSRDTIEGKLDDADTLMLVAEADRQVVGFSESIVVEDEGPGDLLWLHVDPDYRGSGVGSALFEETRDRLMEMGAGHLRGRVLADNATGNIFYEDRGFEQAGQGEVEIDGRPYTVNLYLDAGPAGMLAVETDEGETVYVDQDDSDPGSVAPFHRVYTDEAGEDRYGYYCANCETLANAMDAMGRIECATCGNSRKPTRWDAAYL